MSGHFWLAITCLAVTVSARAATPMGAVPLGNPGEWVTTDDYPALALRREEAGTVAFRLTIDRKGKVVSCIITESSGSEQLDATTCTLMTARAQFRPASDANKRPTAGVYSSRVRWMIPLSPPQNFRVAWSYIVELDGSMSDCRLVTEGIPPPREAAIPTGPTVCPKINLTNGYSDSSGKAVRRRVTESHVITVEDVRP